MVKFSLGTLYIHCVFDAYSYACMHSTHTNTNIIYIARMRSRTYKANTSEIKWYPRIEIQSGREWAGESKKKRTTAGKNESVYFNFLLVISHFLLLKTIFFFGPVCYFTKFCSCRYLFARFLCCYRAKKTKSVRVIERKRASVKKSQDEKRTRSK